MTPISATRCAHTFFKGFTKCRCSIVRGTTLADDGKRYCKRHHPKTIAAKREERRAKFTHESDTRTCEREIVDGLLAHAKEFGLGAIPSVLRKSVNRLLQLREGP